jgi:isopenicillin N synthase-like dioxygenase
MQIAELLNFLLLFIKQVPPNPGVFRLVNHGVPRDLTARLFRLTRDLLDTDPGEKELPGYFGGTPVPSLHVKEYVTHMARITRKLFDALADGGEELALDAAQRPLPLATAHRRKLIHR